MLVVGDREKEEGRVSVRARGVDKGDAALECVATAIVDEVRERRLPADAPDVVEC